MADDRFRPLGGVFSGVRGVVPQSGGAKDASKLALLTKKGELDPSFFKNAIRAVFEKELEDFEARLSGVEADLNSVRPELKYYSDSNDNVVRSELSEEVAKLLNALGRLEEYVDSNDQDIREAIDSLGDLLSRTADDLMAYSDSNDNAVRSELTNEVNKLLSALKQLEEYVDSNDQGVRNYSDENDDKLKKDVDEKIGMDEVAYGFTRWVVTECRKTDNAADSQNDYNVSQCSVERNPEYVVDSADTSGSGAWIMKISQAGASSIKLAAKGTDESLDLTWTEINGWVFRAVRYKLRVPSKLSELDNDIDVLTLNDLSSRIQVILEGYQTELMTWIDDVMNMIARPFDPTATYSAGAMVQYNHSLWVFKQDREAGDWDDSDEVVYETRLTDEIDTLRKQLSSLHQVLAAATGTT